MTAQVGRVRFYAKSGARLYIPQKVIEDSKFPFKDGEVVKIEFGNDSLELKAVAWWEMLDWKSMPDAYDKLPEEIKARMQVKT